MMIAAESKDLRVSREPAKRVKVPALPGQNNNSPHTPPIESVLVLDAMDAFVIREIWKFWE